MNGNLNTEILKALQRTDFEKITHYITDICETIVSDFKKNGRKLPNDENRIRSIMVEEYLGSDKIREDYGMKSYTFLPETQENYDGNGSYIGRADIRIILNVGFVKQAAYYLVECKRIDGTQDLNKKYVGEGIARFITQKYSTYYGKNIMIGFVVKKINISDNTKMIESIQNSANNKHMHGSISFVEKNTDCEMYKCMYHIQSGELELSHLFSDYSDIME